MPEPPWSIAWLAVLLAASAGLAGCSADDREDGPAGPAPACFGGRTRFFGHAPGLHDHLTGLGDDHPMLTVTSRPASAHGFPPLEVEGLVLPTAWSGGVLGMVSWSVAPPRPLAEGQEPLPDATQGSLTVSALSGEVKVGGELPTVWTPDRRDAALDAFLANVTRMDEAARQAVVADSTWTDHPGYPARPPSSSMPSDEPGIEQVGPDPMFLALVPIALSGTLLLEDRLLDASGWTVTSHEGVRVAFVGNYALSILLPVVAAVWDMAEASVEVVTDAEDWTRVLVVTGGHEAALGRELLNATLAGAGWEGEADWQVIHDDADVPLEPGQAGCPTAS